MIYYNYHPYYSSFQHRPNKTVPNPYPKRVTEVTEQNKPTHMNDINRNFNRNSINTHHNHIKHDSYYSNNKPLPLREPLYHEEDCNESKDDSILFEIFGIKLYFDDILLICLIFFLYTEGVEDQYLFIALILLLLS